MKIKHCITGLVLFLGILACAIPGLSQPAPIPTFDPGPLSTTVALTSSAAMSQTAVVATPLPVETPIPTETAIATPKVSLSGTSLLLRDDQTTLFTDREAGIEFIIPAGWMPVRVNEQEYLDAFVSDFAQDPAVYDRLTQIQTADTSRFRLDAFDVRPGHIVNGIITDIHYMFGADDTRSLEEISKDRSEAESIWVDDRLLSSNYEQSANGIEILVIERRYGPSDAVIYNRIVYFKIPSGAIRFSIYTNMEIKDTTLVDFQTLVDSVTLLTP